MIKVICINNDLYPLSLELNKEYDVKDMGDHYIIVDNNHEDCNFPKEIFKII